MEPGRAAIVSLVELTIDFLLSIINAVLTTKQRANTRTHGLTRVRAHTEILLDARCALCEEAKPRGGKAQVKY